MNRARLRKRLIAKENFSPLSYFDGDHWSWGYGTPAPGPGSKITMIEAERQLDRWITIAIDDVITLIGKVTWECLTDLRREVLAELSYNLGWNHLKGFTNMTKAILALDNERVAAEILDSDAARRLPVRYKELADMWLMGEVDETSAEVKSGDADAGGGRGDEGG